MELNKACQLTYKVLDVYEVWNFAETSTELFADYINTFLKLKQESSKLPPWCKTTEDVEMFKKNYADHEGITLDEIEFNPGKRALAKLMLNRYVSSFTFLFVYFVFVHCSIDNLPRLTLKTTQQA